MFQSARGRVLRAAISISAGSCYLLFGYDQGVLGGLVTHPSFLEALGNPSPSYLGTIVALYHIGCLAGCIVAGLAGNRLGRKRTIFWGCIIMVVGGAIQASCYGSAQMIAGRIISGIGNGMNTSTIPVYVSECSRPSSRGRAVSRQMSIVIFGTVVAYWLDYGTVRNLTGDVVWRFPIAFQNFFALVTIFTIPFLPDTPRWLYSHGRKAEAISVLARLLDCSEDDPEVKRTEREMEDVIRFEEESTKLSIKDLINDKTEAKNTRRLVLCFLIQFFQQFTGINVIAFYVTIVLETNVGLSKDLSLLVAGFIQIAFWLGTFPPMVLLDKAGRRPMLMLGSTALSITMVIFTAGIAVNTTASSKLALAMLFLYEISFGMSWNSIPWLYAPEITPLHLRHIGSAVGVFSEWIWTFVIAQMTPPAIANTGWKIYLLFCIMLVLGIPFTYFFLPETSGKTLEEIDFIFVKHPRHTMVDTSVPASGTDSFSSPEKINDAPERCDHTSLA
ncbi:general substrate transporter [Phialemonium atrogriseum]|uniref:General substrate transporter n=1 Tax=Phialemonium atrogriseum TaxID=1093897 RepID=A0AAJ0BT28_9PEZI|nr:general substrate transporter [Phialemonium atrogriseum]KAK1763988.1 general substrate transporter [Phialemonium atrogriseum]